MVKGPVSACFEIRHLTSTSTYLEAFLNKPRPVPSSPYDHRYVQPNGNNIPQCSVMRATSAMGHRQALPLYTRALAIE